MKEERYKLLVGQIASLIEGERDTIAVMSNVVAAIHQAMGFWWTGFYRVVDDEGLHDVATNGTQESRARADEKSSEVLVLGPFQGPVACMRIPYGKGVCGTAWQRGETVVVPDVEQFPGHIACSSESKSEIVVPVFGNDGSVVAVLDIDSEHLDAFDDVDRKYLEEICKLVK